MSSFIVVDGWYYLLRAFFSLPTSISQGGVHTEGIKGSLAVLNNLIQQVKSAADAQIVVVFHQHELATGLTMPPPAPKEQQGLNLTAELLEQIPHLYQLIDALGITNLRMPDISANDLMASLAKRAVLEGHDVVISTGAQVMCQLVDDRIKLIDHMTNRVMDNDAVIERFGVRPDQIVDYMVLMGNSLYGVQGILKVGSKTVARLLQQYGTLAGILEHIDEINTDIASALLRHVDQIPHKQQLFSIVCDLPIEPIGRRFELKPPDVPELKRLYAELGFDDQLDRLQAVG